jgi:hypothetical protein
MTKSELTEEDWEVIKNLADETLVMFEGLPVWQVIHALEIVYAFIGVSTDVPFHTMMNNVLTHYKHLKKEENEL